jgi:class 3 adenylate cyclase
MSPLSEEGRASPANTGSLAEQLGGDRSDNEMLKAQPQEADRINLGSFQSRIRPDAWEVLFRSKELQQKFSGAARHKAFVVSIDMRKSTELMLRAETPELFARFITSLCKEIGDIVVENHGVFDKFTGDGVLGYFPTFFSGEDAGFLALKAASECHACFQRQYLKHRNCFTVLMSDVGLGVGIDFGDVSFVQILGAPTVVGKPVVYACRMGAAPAGQTLLNNPAYRELSTRFPNYCVFHDEFLSVKDGKYIAFSVQFNEEGYTPKRPGWEDHKRTPTDRPTP